MEEWYLFLNEKGQINMNGKKKLAGELQWRHQSVGLDRIYILQNKFKYFSYLRSTKSFSNSVPCGDEKIGWSEVANRRKWFLKLVSSSLKQGGIGCLSVENVSKSTSVHIIPERGNQWNTKKRRKSLRKGAGKTEPERENSICVHLEGRENDESPWTVWSRLDRSYSYPSDWGWYRNHFTYATIALLGYI